MGIILASELCKDVFPNNQGGDFSNVLHKPLNFTGPGESWAVALSEVSYQPDSWHNVHEPGNTISLSLSNFDTYVNRQRVIYILIV